MPGVAEHAEHLVNQQLRCHGVASLKGLTYLRRDSALRKAVKDLVTERLAQHEMEQVRLGNGDIFLIESGALERSTPRVKNRLVILSPFDNCVIQRDRLRSLFQYDYQIECYVPAVKRQYGYFCLPLLYRDEFIGRMDCKAHRKAKHLEIKALHLETDFADDELSVLAFAEAMTEFCRFQECDTVSLTSIHPKSAGPRIQSALNALV